MNGAHGTSTNVFGNNVSRRLLIVLFDSGGTNTLIHSGCLPLGLTPTLLLESQALQTVAGTFSSKRQDPI